MCHVSTYLPTYVGFKNTTLRIPLSPLSRYKRYKAT